MRKNSQVILTRLLRGRISPAQVAAAQAILNYATQPVSQKEEKTVRVTKQKGEAIEQEISRLRGRNKVDREVRRDVLQILPEITDKTEYMRLVGCIMMLEEEISKRSATVRLLSFERQEQECRA